MIEICKQNLENNGFEVVRVKSGDEALNYAKEILTNVGDLSVGLGGSTTLAQIGLLDYIESLDGLTIYNQYKNGITMDENTHLRRMGLISDIYITGVNAITKDGSLINVDGSGNRVAAQIFGPKKVYIFCGTNKIVDSVEAGLERIKNIAIPKNIQRLKEKADKFGKQREFTPKTIARKYSLITSDDIGRTTIVMIDGEWGF